MGQEHVKTVNEKFVKQSITNYFIQRNTELIEKISKWLPNEAWATHVEKELSPDKEIGYYLDNLFEKVQVKFDFYKRYPNYTIIDEIVIDIIKPVIETSVDSILLEMKEELISFAQDLYSNPVEVESITDTTTQVVIRIIKDLYQEEILSVKDYILKFDSQDIRWEEKVNEEFVLDEFTSELKILYPIMAERFVASTHNSDDDLRTQVDKFIAPSKLELSSLIIDYYRKAFFEYKKQEEEFQQEEVESENMIRKGILEEIKKNKEEVKNMESPKLIFAIPDDLSKVIYFEARHPISDSPQSEIIEIGGRPYTLVEHDNAIYLIRNSYLFEDFQEAMDTLIDLKTKENEVQLENQLKKPTFTKSVEVTEEVKKVVYVIVGNRILKRFENELYQDEDNGSDGYVTKLEDGWVVFHKDAIKQTFDEAFKFLVKKFN